MKKTIFFFLVVTFVVNAQSYKQIKVFFDDLRNATVLYKAVPDLDRGFYNRQDNSVTVFVNEKQFEKIKKAGLNYKILIDDWAKYYRNRSKANRSLLTTQAVESSRKFGVKGFSFGSMGGFLTYEEVVQKLDSMRIQYPNLITEKKSIGKSIEGRDIWMVKISDNPDVDEDEPEVFYNSLIHAREPQGMMTLLYYMYYLLENYGKDSIATYLVNNREIYCILVFNPDGYEYNRQTSPNGGGMWRKNRRENSNGTYGVDLNRNWGYKWGYDDEGSSSDPSDQTYRGTAPFSEPETEAVRQFCDQHHFNTALNIHTYSDLVIFPWGYIPKETPDSLIYREYGEEMTRYNNYTYGISDDIIYGVNGDSDDWMYGEQTEKNKIISMTVEIGSGSDGFWPPQSRIYPLAEENLFLFRYLTQVAGGYVSLASYDFSQNVFHPKDSFTFTPVVKNKGLADAGNLVFTVEPVSQFIETQDTIFTATSIPSRQADTLNPGFKMKIKDGSPIGEEQKFVLITKMDGITFSRDTIGVMVGEPYYFVLDKCDSLTNWTVVSNSSHKWEVTSSDYHSPRYSFTDSKNSDYSSNSTVTLTSNSYFDLSGVAHPFLQFWTKFEIEKGWDYGQVLVQEEGSFTWHPIGGKLSHPGSGSFQPHGEPVYDGKSKGWRKEIIDLSQFAGKKIKIRFRLKSDEYVEYDGWHIDDIAIFYYVLSNVQKESLGKFSFGLFQNYPNPFNPATEISYSLPKTVNVSLNVYNVLGQKVATLVNNKLEHAGNYKVTFNASSLPSGIYFYTLQAGSFRATKKMVVLK